MVARGLSVGEARVVCFATRNEAELQNSGSGAASRSVTGEVAVIVNKSNPVNDLSMTKLRNIMLGQETNWPDGKKIAVLMTTPGQPERNSTLKVVCKMTETDFTLYFVHASGGANPPQAYVSGEKVRQSVASTASAIGFIRSSQLDDSVKVITIDGSGWRQAPYKLKLTY